MIHFRILIPSGNLRGYTRRFENTRQNSPANHKILADVPGYISLDFQVEEKCDNFVTTPLWSDTDSGTEHARPIVVRVTERERVTILAALRRWLSYPAVRDADLTATNRGKHKPLDDGEIQRLCKRLSETPPSGGQSNNRANIQKHPKLRAD
jgi:hypothetical protein